MRLIVTRPLAQAQAWVHDLRALGQDAEALPLIDIAPPPDPAGVRAAWQRLAGYRLVMFVSANAVTHFFALAPAAAWPAGVWAGSTGPGTSAALLRAGVPAQALVAPAADAAILDSEALWAQLVGHDWQGRQALVVRGEDGRDWLADTLRARGAQVDFVAAYTRRAPQPSAAGRALLARALAAPADHLWLFSSSQAVGHLRLLAPAADWSRAQALASHPRIAQAALAAGFGSVQAAPATPQGIGAWLTAGLTAGLNGSETGA